MLFCWLKCRAAWRKALSPILSAHNSSKKLCGLHHPVGNTWPKLQVQALDPTIFFCIASAKGNHLGVCWKSVETFSFWQSYQFASTSSLWMTTLDLSGYILHVSFLSRTHVHCFPEKCHKTSSGPLSPSSSFFPCKSAHFVMVLFLTYLHRILQSSKVFTHHVHECVLVSSRVSKTEQRILTHLTLCIAYLS